MKFCGAEAGQVAYLLGSRFRGLQCLPRSRRASDQATCHNRGEANSVPTGDTIKLESNNVLSGNHLSAVCGIERVCGVERLSVGCIGYEDRGEQLLSCDRAVDRWNVDIRLCGRSGSCSKLARRRAASVAN